MSHPRRPHIYYGETTALCATCLRPVPAKELIADGRVYLDKRCPDHGRERVLIAEDADYWRQGRERFVKPGEQVLAANTPVRWGCPYDCGICPDHEQHGCLTLLEITDHCDLRCPICYADSGPQRQTHRDLATIEAMLDRIVANEGEPDVVQISGGEPTRHPDFFAVLDACRRRPIKHLMLNTNGVRLAREDGFAERLAAYAPGFEIYLQFDSLRPEPLRDLRGVDLREERQRCLERLDACDLSTTLVVTCKAGVNDDELGAIIDHALAHRCVRGVTIQPVQHAGRSGGFDPARHRLTVSGVRRRILEQSEHFAPADILPVPCHPDHIAMAYGLRRRGGGLQPLTGQVDPAQLLDAGGNTIAFERDPAVRQAFVAAWSAAHGPAAAASRLRQLLCCLPGVAAPESLDYRDVFRLIILQFGDRHSLDLRNARKACVHIAHPDGRRVIPFDTYNLFYRDELEATVLEPLRRWREAAWNHAVTPVG